MKQCILPYNEVMCNSISNVFIYMYDSIEYCIGYLYSMYCLPLIGQCNILSVSHDSLATVYTIP